MNTTIITTALAQVETPLLAVVLSAGTTVPPSLADLDRAAGGLIARALATGDFKGKRDDTLLLYPPGGKAQRLLLVGVGKVADVTPSALRRAAAIAGKRARAT